MILFNKVYRCLSKKKIKNKKYLSGLYIYNVHILTLQLTSSSTGIFTTITNLTGIWLKRPEDFYYFFFFFFFENGIKFHSLPEAKRVKVQRF